MRAISTRSMKTRELSTKAWNFRICFLKSRSAFCAVSSDVFFTVHPVHRGTSRLPIRCQANAQASGCCIGRRFVDIVVSNRVARVTPGGPMMGGLASALLPAVRKSGVVWFGSSGRLRPTVPGATPLVQLESYGRGTIATVDLPEQHYSGFYEGFANSTLWPLLHTRPDLSRPSTHDYAAYTEVNAY